MTNDLQPLTVAQWREVEAGEMATPQCPICRVQLGILPGAFQEKGRDVWLCNNCGEFETA